MDNAVSINLIALYRKRAKRYDWTTLLLYFVGFRHWAYRTRSIQAGSQAGRDGSRARLRNRAEFRSVADANRPRRKNYWSGPNRCHARRCDRPHCIGWLVKRRTSQERRLGSCFSPSRRRSSLHFALTPALEFDEFCGGDQRRSEAERRFVILDFKRPSGWFMSKTAPVLAKLLSDRFREGD
jgi:hypothetical protein